MYILTNATLEFHMTTLFKYIILLTLLFFISCSKSPEEKAESYVRENLIENSSAKSEIISTNQEGKTIFVTYLEDGIEKIAAITFDDEMKDITIIAHTDIGAIKSLTQTIQNLDNEVASATSTNKLLELYSFYDKLNSSAEATRCDQMEEDRVMPIAYISIINDLRSKFNNNAKDKFGLLIGIKDSTLSVDEKIIRVKEFATTNWNFMPEVLKGVIINWINSVPNLDESYNQKSFEELRQILFPTSHGVRGLSSGSGFGTRGNPNNEAFNIGRQAGYSDGMRAANRGASHGYGYDDTNSYSDSWIREAYISGYMMGYDAGYADGGGNSYPDDEDYYEDYDY